jgi:hypothetical protein
VAAKMIVQAQTRISRLRRPNTADIELSSTHHTQDPPQQRLADLKS